METIWLYALCSSGFHCLMSDILVSRIDSPPGLYLAYAINVWNFANQCVMPTCQDLSSYMYWYSVGRNNLDNTARFVIIKFQQSIKHNARVTTASSSLGNQQKNYIRAKYFIGQLCIQYIWWIGLFWIINFSTNHDR